jgi:hypothetical protein
MEEIKNFLTELIKKEKDAVYYQGYKEKLGDYNKVVKELNLFVSDLMPPLMREHDSPPFSERYYKEVVEFEEPVNTRHLYKISEYNNEEYGKIWACYVSVANPIEGITKLLSNCFIVVKIDEDYKIVAKFVPDMDTDKWRHVGGNESINYYKLGKPIAIERIMSPENDKWSIEEYLKDR